MAKACAQPVSILPRLSGPLFETEGYSRQYEKMNEILNLQVSLFSGFYDNEPVGRQLKEVVDLATSENCKLQTEEIRRLRALANSPSTEIGEAMKDKKKAITMKKDLPSFLTNVYCEHGKKRVNVKHFLPMLGFDVDHISEAEVVQLMEQLKADEHVIFAEPSCSRQGVHFVIRTETDTWLNARWDGKDTGPYAFVWQQARAYVEETFNVEVDEACKNLEHIFAISYDELIYFNAEAKSLPIDTASYAERAVGQPTHRTHNAVPAGTYHAFLEEVYQTIVEMVEKKGLTFTEGSRNNYVYHFAMYCNHYGVAQGEVERFGETNFIQSDLEENEVMSTIRSAYSNQAEHGIWCATCVNAQVCAKEEENSNRLIINKTLSNEQACANAQTTQNSVQEEQEIIFQDTFSDKIDPSDWCAYFQPVLDSMDDAEGKDKMILASLVINSGMLPNLFGIYGSKRVFPPLYILFFGPTASRKGEIASCQHIIAPLSREFSQAYEKEFVEYKLAHDQWEAMGSKAADRTNRGEEPQEPVDRSPVIAANSSASAAYLALKANDGWGIMFETEASALTQSLLSDYGNYSTGLLAAFHHEPIKMNRVRDKIRFEIENPRLALALTCTKGQLPKLFPTFEDGFANRFLFYGLNRKLVWINPFKQVDKPLDEIYEELGQKSLELYHLMKALGDRRIQFLLTGEQIAQFNDFFSELLMEQFSMLGDGISSFIFRLGLSTFRISMTLALLRRYSEWDRTKPFFEPDEQAMLCGEKDFRIAMTIMNTLVNHTATIYADLAKDDEGADKSKELSKLQPTERRLFEALSDTFTSEEARNTAITLGINPETARGYTSHFVKYKVAQRIKNGVYQKVSSKQANKHTDVSPSNNVQA